MTVQRTLCTHSAVALAVPRSPQALESPILAAREAGFVLKDYPSFTAAETSATKLPPADLIQTALTAYVPLDTVAEPDSKLRSVYPVVAT